MKLQIVLLKKHWNYVHCCCQWTVFQLGFVLTEPCQHDVDTKSNNKGHCCYWILFALAET